MSRVTKPIKRHEALKPLSREHHEGLLLCWKIRTGLQKNIDMNRIVGYCKYFFDEHLVPHFETEEKLVFPILGYDNEHVKKALQDHLELKKLFNMNVADKKILNILEKKLEDHIRFEERILFNEIQNVASASEFKKLESVHEEKTNECWDDRFWA